MEGIQLQLIIEILFYQKLNEYCIRNVLGGKTFPGLLEYSLLSALFIKKETLEFLDALKATLKSNM